MTSDQKIVQQQQDEIKRLVNNSSALLDVMPEMVFLLTQDKKIQYMNPVAIKNFGDLRGKPCHEHLCFSDNNCTENCPIILAMEGRKNEKPTEIGVGQREVEYSYIPFLGYEGHHMVMILMHDITEKKQQLREIETFNQSIEQVLEYKINELKESESIRTKLSQEVNVLKRKLQQNDPHDEIVGTSKPMNKVRELVYQVASTNSTVLITGESGTGKELVASMLAKNSDRHHKPFLKINCGTINENLLESELFGYEKGAFTGATGEKKGKFEVVDGGTIFLDEIGDISPRMQASLLRVLQNGEVIRVGGSAPIHVDVRIIAATNKDLQREVQEKNFRLDLFYRLNIINIRIPPLRERKDDIADLTVHFISLYRKAFKKEIDFVPNNVMDKLLRHNWPGNVRELENVLQRAILMTKNSMITEEDIAFESHMMPAEGCGYFEKLIELISHQSLKQTLAEAERDLIEHVLQNSNWDISASMKKLKIGRTALYDKIKKYQISFPHQGGTKSLSSFQ